MDESLRHTVLELAERDLAVRSRLVANASLFEGYHPEMRAVHERNAAALEAILSDQGWPNRGLVGEEGADAAWLVAQHAIGLPDFQRRCLVALPVGR